MHVSELYVYPIKSARGIPLTTAQLEPRGFTHDRRWMLVDDEGVFISQREEHRMSLIDVALGDDGLQLSAPGVEPLTVEFEPKGTSIVATIWSDSVEAVLTSKAAHDWFSTFLGRSCRLVFMPDSTKRIVDPRYTDEQRVVGFADAFPLLIIGDGSLHELNQRLVKRGQAPVPMQRFRPNIVVGGVRPHHEDEWEQIRIGETDIDVVKPCGRCAITTVDFETGEASAEPLRTLSGYRKRGSKVMFGQNAVPRRLGSLSIADTVQILTWRH